MTAIVVAGGSNAINIIDGFNGLSSSTHHHHGGRPGGCRHSSTATAWSSKLGACWAIGATLGFLAVNYPRGKLFLGDGGAYFLGFWVSEMAVLLLVRNLQRECLASAGDLRLPGHRSLVQHVPPSSFIQKVSPGAPDALHLHTLVYRRLVFKHVRQGCPSSMEAQCGSRLRYSRPWLPFAWRSACWSALRAPVSLLIVVAQVVLYVDGLWPPRAWPLDGRVEAGRVDASMSADAKLR